MSFVIYLDHNATTPILPEVLEAMMPYLTTEWGNPSSAYKFGSKLKSVVETAREQVAELIGAPSRDVIFTSCATESNNTAIAAALKANPAKRHIVTSQVEHSSVLNYCMALERGGPDCSGGSTTAVCSGRSVADSRPWRGARLSRRMRVPSPSRATASPTCRLTARAY